VKEYIFTAIFRINKTIAIFFACDKIFVFLIFIAFFTLIANPGYYPTAMNLTDMFLYDNLLFRISQVKGGDHA